ncbi:29254_t:CDS:2, partial [Gigaspora margarita]
NINKQKVEFLKNKLLDLNDKTKMHERLKEKESNQFELAYNLMKETENKLHLFFTILDLSLSVGKVVIQHSIDKVSKLVQDVLENVIIENIRKLVSITDNEDLKKPLDLAKDINDKANKIKEITNDQKHSHAKAVELYKSVESLSKDAEYFNIKNIDQKGIMLHYK